MIVFTPVNGDAENQGYEGRDENGKLVYMMERETGTKTPGGNRTDGHWVVRNTEGEMVGVDKYRHDLMDQFSGK